MKLNNYLPLHRVLVIGGLFWVLPLLVQAQIPASIYHSNNDNGSSKKEALRLTQHGDQTSDVIQATTMNSSDDNDNGGKGNDSNGGGTVGDIGQHNTASNQNSLTSVSGVGGADIYSSRASSICPRLFSNISLSNILPCSTTTAQVSYCNHGTARADNVYLDVTIDHAFTLSGATVAYSSQGGNVYRFQVGTVDPNDCLSFDLFLQISCDTTLIGDEFCIDAHIYPDTLCTGSLSSAPILLVDGDCLGQSVKFHIDNRGGNISAQDQVRFIIIEDHLLVGGGSSILAQGAVALARHSVQTEEVIITSPAQTHFRLELRDANNQLLASSAIQHCNSTGLSHTTNYYANTFWNDSPLPAISQGCAIMGNWGIQANGSPSQGSPSSISTNVGTPSTLVHIAPNPMIDRAIISLENAEAREYTFELYDATGQRVYTRTLSAGNRLYLERRNWAAGMYYYRLFNTGTAVTQGKLLLR